MRFGAVLANAMGKFCIGTRGNVIFQVLPYLVVIPDTFAEGANGEESVQGVKIGSAGFECEVLGTNGKPADYH